MKVLSDKAQNKVICVFLLIGSIGLVVYGVTHIFSSIEYKLSSDVRQVTAVVKDYQISVKTDEDGDEDVKYHAILSFEVDGKTYTGKDVFSRDISRGDEVTEKAYRALNGIESVGDLFFAYSDFISDFHNCGFFRVFSH